MASKIISQILLHIESSKFNHRCFSIIQATYVSDLLIYFDLSLSKIFWAIFYQNGQEYYWITVGPIYVSSGMT